MQACVFIIWIVALKKCVLGKQRKSCSMCDFSEFMGSYHRGLSIIYLSNVNDISNHQSRVWLILTKTQSIWSAGRTQPLVLTCKPTVTPGWCCCLATFITVVAWRSFAIQITPVHNSSSIRSCWERNDMIQEQRGCGWRKHSWGGVQKENSLGFFEHAAPTVHISKDIYTFLYSLATHCPFCAFFKVIICYNWNDLHIYSLH